MENNTTFAELFILAIRAEKTTELVYNGLARKFSEFAEISTFWGKMATDESEHARYIQNIRDSLTPTQLKSNADLDVLCKAREALKYSANDLLRTVRTFDDAYNLAHIIENSEINFVFSFLKNKFANPTKVACFISAELEDHLGRLMDFGEKYKDKVFRKSILASSEKTSLQLTDKQ